MFLSNIKSYEEFIDVVKLLYRVNKHSLRLKSHHKETEKIVHENMRMGIGVTGVLQATEEQRSWLSKAYEELREFDEEYSAKNNWPISIKLTTCKPSGSVSLLPGVTPGIHPAYSQYMIRRIRISSNHPLVTVCKESGYDVEYQRNFDGSEDRGTVVVSFPFSYPEGTKLAKDMTAIDQLNEVRNLQKDWSDNSVSCTVYYRKEELPAIRNHLEKFYKDSHKSLSFLLHNEHGFDQAPLEEITKEEYEQMVSRTKIIKSLEGDVDFEAQDECASGMCPIK